MGGGRRPPPHPYHFFIGFGPGFHSGLKDLPLCIVAAVSCYFPGPWHRRQRRRCQGRCGRGWQSPPPHLVSPIMGNLRALGPKNDSYKGVITALYSLLCPKALAKLRQNEENIPTPLKGGASQLSPDEGDVPKTSKTPGNSPPFLFVIAHGCHDKGVPPPGAPYRGGIGKPQHKYRTSAAQNPSATIRRPACCAAAMPAAVAAWAACCVFVAL